MARQELARELGINWRLQGEVVSTGKLPRYYGTPRDEQLDEDSSIEGILHGRKLSEVIASDTRELSEAGISWEEAIYVLKCLAIANWEQDERLRLAYKKERKGVDEAEEREAPVVGFGQAIRVYATGSPEQIDDPIKDVPEMGDGNMFDRLAYNGPERKLIVRDKIGEFRVVVCKQTLMQAEKYHLLEKGNSYALTGTQLARIVALFRYEEFEKLFAWANSRLKKIEEVIWEMMIGHIEQVKLVGGGEQYFFISRSGLDFSYIRGDNFFRCEVDALSKVIKVNLGGGRKYGSCRMEIFPSKVEICTRDWLKNEDKRRTADDNEFRLAQIVRQLVAYAKNNRDGMLTNNWDLVTEMMERTMEAVRDFPGI